jgi:hypothetical protein
MVPFIRKKKQNEHARVQEALKKGKNPMSEKKCT